MLNKGWFKSHHQGCERLVLVQYKEDAVHKIWPTVLVSPLESEPSRHYQATYQQCFQEEQLKSQGLPEAHCYGQA